MRTAAFTKLLPAHIVPSRGLTSVCSAHPLVVEAALLQGIAEQAPVLIEATCNQTNQDGGYTGLTPRTFRALVEEIAERVGFPRERLILGGDHLGPNPWRSLEAETAMHKAEAMVAAYVEAGFTKIHLDTSMGCAGEPAGLDDETIATRAARLAHIAEETARHKGLAPPCYIIGTEVPPPGGAVDDLDHLAVTRVAAARDTVEIHRRTFAAAGLEAAFERVLGIVVQPGVEFSADKVACYDPPKAAALSALLAEFPNVVFEAHSTDYQPRQALAHLVSDGFAILKVGPGLTFALRETLYGLDHIARTLDGDASLPSLEAVMEAAMLDDPSWWQGHYGGEPWQQRIQRHYSYSDRIRYYWGKAGPASAVHALMARLAGTAIPTPLISQYLGRLSPLVTAGLVQPHAKALIIAAIRQVLADYWAACGSPARRETVLDVH